jgi:hypothetical protein
MVYKCENCDKIYKKKKYLREHIKIKHSRSVKPLQCVKCDQFFLNKYALKKHLYQVHPSKLHSCTFCGSSFKASRKYFNSVVSISCIHRRFLTLVLLMQTKSKRDHHITSVHTREKYFPCKICPSKFSTAVGLRGTN